MRIKQAKKIIFMQDDVLCIYPKSEKHIIDIRIMFGCKCPDNSLD